MARKPDAQSSFGERELDKAEKQLDAFNESVRSLTLDTMNIAPKYHMEPQTKLSQNEITKAQDIYLKPAMRIPSAEKFNEEYRMEYNFMKEYVKLMAENKMIEGEIIEMWTKPFPGLPAEFWKVPVNKPIFAPRYVAEQIKRAKYHVLSMQESSGIGSDQMGQYYGSMVAKSTIQRLDAVPVNDNKSIFIAA